MTIDATVGGPSANSYITAADALIYFEGRFGASGYVNASDADREKLLRTAVTFLDSRVTWIGDIKDQTTPQALAWPRVFDFTLDTPEDILVLGVAIPQDLKNAQCELALFVVDNGEPSDSNSLDAIKVGSLSIDFNEFQSSQLVPDKIWSMISYLGARFTTKDFIKSVALSR